MAYVLTDGSTTVLEYPYNIGVLRRDNPNVSFPSELTEEQFRRFNVYSVIETPEPEYDGLAQTLTEVNPITSNGGVTWEQAWEVTSLTSEDAQSFYNAAIAEVRTKIKTLKAEIQTFYTESIITGYGFNTEMNSYVEAISNPETLPGYPLISEWPTLPENKFDTNNTELPINAYSKQKMNEVLDQALAPVTQQISAVVSEEILGGFEEALL